MRRSLVLLLLPLPAAVGAWEFRAEPVCTLEHDTGEAAIAITYDHTTSEYRLDLTLAGKNWSPSSNFGIAFEGRRPLTIGTQRHRTDGSTLSVTDSGFGNVLDGLEFNDRAIAFTGKQFAALPLDSAGVPVRQFRACTETAPATS